MFLSEWHQFPSAPCLAGKKLNDSSNLDVEIVHDAWHSSFQPVWQEKTRNSAHEQTPLSSNTIDSVLRHRGVGQAKGLSAPPRIDILSIPHLSFIMFLQVSAAVAAGTLRTVTASVATVPVSIAAVAGAPVSIATVSMAPMQIPPPVVTMAQATLAVEGKIL